MIGLFCSRQSDFTCCLIFSCPSVTSQWPHQFSHGPLHFFSTSASSLHQNPPFFCSCYLGSDDKLLAVFVIHPLIRPLTLLSDSSVCCQQARRLCAVKFFFFKIFWGFESLLNPTWNERNYNNKNAWISDKRCEQGTSKMTPIRPQVLKTASAHTTSTEM